MTLISSALSVSAQILVGSSGQVVMGEPLIENGASKVAISDFSDGTTVDNTLSAISVDSLATAVFLGNRKDNRGGYITFGPKKNIWIGEYNSIRYGILEMGFQKGMQGVCPAGTVFRCTPITASSNGLFQFFTDVRANSLIVDSDSKIKSDVESLSLRSSNLADLTPISYRLTGQAEKSDGTLSKKSLSLDTSDSQPMQPDSRVRFGFMAQEVQELFPELVTADEDGTLGIDYIGFIPLLIDAYKDVKKQLDEQTAEMLELLKSNGLQRRMAGVDSSIAEVCRLYQNKPNPFSSTTLIETEIPASATIAYICIYDMQGKQIARHDVSCDNPSVSIEGAALNPGMYMYALIVDGVEVDCKKMILTD